MLTSNEIRQQFLDYFVQQCGHTAVPSASVIPHGDETLLFTNAGMNQFKDVFLGTGSRPFKRAVDTQKCIRASGKHNDLDDVGRDTYHHTFFEMLGNWSFGDYYKAEAIRWAWELLTKVWGIDKSRLHATVFGGNDKVPADEEAASLWTKVTDIPPAQIHRFGAKENFWMMGPTGPCGPCSEIHIDRTPDKSGGPLVNVGDARVMEIWNLVFIQYNCDEQGILSPLPAKHVDTGMGFERVTAVLQNQNSNYDTDVFRPLLDAISDLTGKKYGGRLEDPTDIAFRVLADHLRMTAFSITDGALPDNQGRGSVIKSVLRRAVRFGWQCFQQREPMIYKLVPVLVNSMGHAFPELKTRPDYVAEVIRREEADFLGTVESGLKLFEKAAKRAESSRAIVSGHDAFELHSTHGFPLDLTRQMAQERKLTVDEDDYERLKKEHADISRAKKGAQQVALNVQGGLPTTDDRARWSSLQGQGTILGWIENNEFITSGSLQAASDDSAQVGLLLDKTCFYAESGGQVGDHGLISQSSGTFEVSQTTKLGDAIVHVGRVRQGEIVVGQPANLQVSTDREFTRKNHTTTHLLHWALQNVLGEHVEQRGSKVKPDEFTFDFSHPQALTAPQRAQIEELVNEKIYQALPVKWDELAQDDAKKLPGVRAFFGDKYGDVVRVVTIGDGFSQEFCGGTHLDNTGQAGFFKILSEEAVGKGVRRITGATAKRAVEIVQKLDSVVGALTSRLSCQPEDLPTRFDALQQEIKKLQQQLKKGANADLKSLGDQLLDDATDVNGTKVIVGQVPPCTMDALREQSDRLRQKANSAVIFLAFAEDGKVQLLAAATDDLVQRGFKAGHLVGRVAQLVGGKGGGRPNFATAGGNQPENLEKALDQARGWAREALAGAPAK